MLKVSFCGVDGWRRGTRRATFGSSFSFDAFVRDGAWHGVFGSDFVRRRDPCDAASAVRSTSTLSHHGAILAFTCLLLALSVCSIQLGIAFTLVVDWNGRPRQRQCQEMIVKMYKLVRSHAEYTVVQFSSVACILYSTVWMHVREALAQQPRKGPMSNREHHNKLRRVLLLQHLLPRAPSLKGCKSVLLTVTRHTG